MVKHCTCIAVVVFLTWWCTETSAGSLRLSERHNGRTVQVAAGDHIDIALPANPTTGYGWTLSSYNRLIIRETKDPDYKADSKLIGAGGISSFHFKAIKKGHAVLRLTYQRPWEKGIKPVNSFEVFVRIK